MIINFWVISGWKMSTIEWYLHLYCDYFQVSFLLRDSKLDVCGSWTKRRHLGTFFTKISDRWSTNQSGVRIIISSDLVYCKLHVRTLRVVHWSQDFWLPPKPREFFCLSVNIHFAKLPLRRSELALVQKKTARLPSVVPPPPSCTVFYPHLVTVGEHLDNGIRLLESLHRPSAWYSIRWRQEGL